MAPAAEPTQSEVLRERASRVPWRRAIGDAVLGLAGRGPMQRPDRLEGAVYGHLLAADRVGDGRQAALLDQLEALLTGSGHAEPPDGSWAASALAPALVLRHEPASVVAATAAEHIEPASEDPATVASGVLYALAIQELLAGERASRSVLGRARSVALESSGHAVHRVLRSGLPSPFDAAWQAVVNAHDYEGAMSRLDATDDAVAAATMAGGLAGARWGSSNLPASQRRRVPSPARARRFVDRLIETDDPGRGGRAWQTSTSAPLAVHGVDLSGVDPVVAGSIGITPLPGRRYVAYHTGAHWRDLDTDVRRLGELGIGLVLLLVEDRELARCRVAGIEDVLGDHGIDLVRYPIRDPLVPRDGRRFRATVARVLGEVRGGRCVAVACRGGFDRAAMAAACLLREAGLDGATAIERLQRARPGALTLPDQQAYVRDWPPGR